MAYIGNPIIDPIILVQRMCVTRNIVFFVTLPVY